MNRTDNVTGVVDEPHATASDSSGLGTLRRNQRRLLYGGGGLLTLLMVLAALGNCLYGLDGYRSAQKDVFQEGRTAINTFLIQRGISQSSSLNANDALWSTRQPYLAEIGMPLMKSFTDGGEKLLIQPYSTAAPWLVVGHDTAAMPAATLSAYLGMISEYSSYTASSFSAMLSLVPLTVYGYDPSGSLLAITGVTDEAQLLHALNVPDRQQALAKLRVLEAGWDARIKINGSKVLANNGRIQFYFARNPITDEPSVVEGLTLAVNGKPYFRRFLFESVARLLEQLQPFSPSTFMIVSRGGELITENSQLPGSSAEHMSILRKAGIWSAWPTSQTSRRVGGTYLIADELKGVNWTIVHLYTWQEMVAGVWKRLATTAAVTAVILTTLWLLLLGMDRRIFAPALAGALRVYESEELNRAIIETSPVGLCLLDVADANPILQNDVMREYAERTDDPSASLYALLVQQAEQSAFTRGDRALRSAEFQITTQRTDGRRRDLLVAATRTNYARKSALLCVLRDVTARIELEERLRQARRDSEQATLAAELASRAKSSFVAMMSHEIRTPLNGILGHLELLTRSMLDPSQREKLNRVRLSADTLLTTISDVLDFSRIEAGQLIIDPVSFNVRALVEQIALLFAPSAQRKGLKLYIGVDAALQTTYVADAHRIRQILNNLIGNAVKFTESGRIALRASAANDGGVSPVVLRFDVIDSGIGMSDEQLGQLFEPFSQADASISRRYGGSGLGLALCRQLSELLGGSVSVQSTPGVGSIFSLELPVQEDTSARAEDISGLSGKRIALLSGAAEWRTEISALLVKWGVEVTVLAQPSTLEAALVARIDALLIFGVQQTWDEHEEQELVAHAKRVIRAQADGPLQPEWRDGCAYISCYSSAALRRAIVESDGGDAVLGGDPESAPVIAQRGKVLLVDDNPVNRELIQQQLEAIGFSADVAEDGEVALRLWRDDTYVAVLTDINMPNMNGYELTLHLRGRGIEVPILAITATALASEKLRSEQTGITDLLLKPLSLDQLDAAMSKHVSTESRVLPEEPRSAHAVSTQRGKFPDKIRGVFVQSGTHDLEDILRAWSNHDASHVLERLHSLKGALLMLGEQSVAGECSALENHVTSEGLDGTDHALADFECSMRDLLDRYAQP